MGGRGRHGRGLRCAPHPRDPLSHQLRQPPSDKRTERLTRREREVAHLVARGLTNRQIASELSVSRNTANNHVARILRKLGLRSRAQIAAWVTERRSPSS